MRISIVIPAYNEDANIQPLFEELVRQMEQDKDLVENFQIIFVDDGSTDATLKQFQMISDARVTVVSLGRHRGKSHALQAGFNACIHDVIATMDADLQNDPADLRTLLDTLQTGYDFVQTWRMTRRDSFLKRASTKIANGIRRMALGDDFSDINCGLRVFRTSAIRGLDFFEGMHRFLPLLVRADGGKVTQVKTGHRPRLHGRSKYGLWDRAFHGARDLWRVRRMLRQKGLL